MVGDLASAINAPLIYIGDKLGLFKAMADGQPVNSEELAQKTGLTERYVREWLHAMIAAEYLAPMIPILAERASLPNTRSCSPKMVALYSSWVRRR